MLSVIQSALLITLTKRERELVKGVRKIRVRTRTLKNAPITKRLGVLDGKFIQRLKDANIPFVFNTPMGSDLHYVTLEFPVSHE
jgi:hypothetical protein